MKYAVKINWTNGNVTYLWVGDRHAWSIQTARKHAKNWNAKSTLGVASVEED